MEIWVRDDIAESIAVDPVNSIEKITQRTGCCKISMGTVEEGRDGMRPIRLAGELRQRSAASTFFMAPSRVSSEAAPNGAVHGLTNGDVPAHDPFQIPEDLERDNPNYTGVYMQLSDQNEAFDSYAEDEFRATLDLVLVPQQETNPSGGPAWPAQALFDAISACAELHPDPLGDEEEEGGLDLNSMITADNMHEFEEDE
jgi:hypothetical protein